MTSGQPGGAEQNGDHGPGVLVRPPLLYMGALVLGVALDLAVMPASLDSLGLSGGARLLLGMALLAAGIFLMAAAMRRFAKAGTPVRTSEAVETLVTGGIYRLTRNPIYLGLTANYLGISVLADAPAALALLAIVLPVMRYGVIGREERYLEGKYGDAYRAFKRRTGRWLGPV
ncbi:MAG: methyltransferase family protein [Alphaproteobacteria bacterium]